ncbi:MAG: MarR family winged helix-turn-helix transcriptional regulator [Candidatus Binataceae bacterium]
MATSAERGPIAPARQAADLLELFYPVHYRVNMAVEDAMRGPLTRKQAAILWLIRSAGSGGGRWMRRKEIVVRLQNWFEVTSPAITQTLRGMARPPLGLVRLVEDAASAREKRVLLTPKGERFVSTMVARGREFLRELVEQLPGDRIGGGIEFLRAGILAFELLHGKDTGASRNGVAREQRSAGVPARTIKANGRIRLKALP